MRPHEVECFRERIPTEFELCTSNLTQGPWDLSITEEYEIVMVGGSGGYGATENEEPWFEPTLQFLRQVVDLGKPLFCSCWGHEALAVALGGQVEMDPLGYELGLLPVTLSPHGRADPLFATLPCPFVTPIGHEEQVVKLPQNGLLLASTERCRVQAYRIQGRPVYSTQFHPELSSQRLWERVEAYIPHLRDEHRGHDQACTDNLIAEFLKLYA
jgi:GMP synthase (glutamine-hydrolysing)